jgi:hypothetical protein
MNTCSFVRLRSSSVKQFSALKIVSNLSPRSASARGVGENEYFQGTFDRDRTNPLRGQIGGLLSKDKRGGIDVYKNVYSPFLDIPKRAVSD